jgi:ATP-dependent helicase HrpB
MKTQALQQLPIDAYRDQIVQWYRSPATSLADRFLCLVAETGAGKSTRVPRYLIDAGATVLVTQPRRIAARMVAERVAEELGEELGRTVGYRTASRDDSCDSAATRCLFATDGLALVREIMGSRKQQVLVLDEVHEWNLNVETLLAYVRGQVEGGADLRVVLMSATLDAAALSAYLFGAQTISVPGRTFPVTEQKPCSTERSPADNLAADAASLARSGRNVLVFQPGKREIEECAAAVRARGVGAVYALHGEMGKDEQRAAVRACKSGRGVVVIATNVAQTSLTIDGVDAVVDSGLAREMHVTHGIETLRLVPVSKADRKQRAGRAGRTKPGVYIPHGPAAELDYPTPEIQRTALDSVYLRLLDAGYQPDSLRFFHAPPAQEWERAKRFLSDIGFIDGAGITTMGSRSLKLGMDPRLARMVIEGERRGVLADVITAAAILQSPITDRRIESGGKPLWHSHAGGETRSDVIAQIALLRKLERQPGRAREMGCHSKSVADALQIRREIAERLSRTVPRITSSGDAEAILKSLIAGSPDRIYRYSPARRSGDWYCPADQSRRNVGADSVVRDAGEWRIGVPVSIQTQKGTYAHLLTCCSGVRQEWLAEVLPALVAESNVDGSATYSPETDSVTVQTRRMVCGHDVGRGSAPCLDQPRATAAIAGWLVSL